MEPQRHSVESLGLNLNVLEWPCAHASATVLLHHGFLDFARAWQPVAERLASDFRVLAVDARGHGDSDWVGAGGYYHFQDYSFDLQRVVTALVDGPLVLVGHSLGGMACGYYAGAFPERVAAYVSMEGLGPPDNSFAAAPERMKLWIESVAKQRSKAPRSFATVAEAAARLRAYNPRIDDAKATFLAEHNLTPAADGGWRWKFDPLHQTRSPQPFYLEQARVYWQRLTCPVLYIDGALSGFGTAYAARLENFRHVTHKTIANAGHMMHYDQPEVLADALADFCRRLST